MKRIYSVRQREAKGNVENVIKHPDTEMTELGHSLAKQLAERCSELAISAIVSSPLRRAQQTDHKSLVIHLLLQGEQTIERHVSSKKMVADHDHIGITEFCHIDGHWQLLG